MREELRRRASRTLVQTLVPVPLGRAFSPNCRNCSEALALDQPNPDHPDRLLGVCPECGDWEIIEIIASGLDAWVTVIPRGFWHAKTAWNGDP